MVKPSCAPKETRRVELSSRMRWIPIQSSSIETVTKPRVTMLKPRRRRPHVKTVDAQLALCTDVDSQCCTSTNPVPLSGCHSPSESEEESIFIMVIACR